MALFQTHGKWFCWGFGLLVAASALAGPAVADDKPIVMGWSGQITLGGSLATGNTDREALDLDSKFQLQSEHRQDVFKVLGDIASENGISTAERTEASAQTNYDVSKDKFYLLGFAQYVRDRFTGFSYEVEVGPGVGYRFFHTDNLTLSVELSSGYYHAALSNGAGH
jgi:putative salt-induced outer membrane protein YdiY